MCKTLLQYPDLNELFGIHTDAIDYHLGAVISQSGKHIALYIHKIPVPQTLYKVSEKE